VINKVDLPSAEPERVINEIEDVIGLEAQDAPQISAKTGLNVDQVLEQVKNSFKCVSETFRNFESILLYKVPLSEEIFQGKNFTQKVKYLLLTENRQKR